MTTDLKPGYEMDATVASALGIADVPDSFSGMAIYNTFSIAGARKTQCTRQADGRVFDIPCYSTDLNAAFEAAERVGLLGGLRFLTKQNGLYVVAEYFSGAYLHDRDLVIASGFTPAEAICRAILALKGMQ